MCWFWGRRKYLEIVPALWELRLVVGVGGGRAWTETSQPAVEGSTYQRCLLRHRKSRGNFHTGWGLYLSKF